MPTTNCPATFESPAITTLKGLNPLAAILPQISEAIQELADSLDHPAASENVRERVVRGYHDLRTAILDAAIGATGDVLNVIRAGLHKLAHVRFALEDHLAPHVGQDEALKLLAPPQPAATKPDAA